MAKKVTGVVKLQIPAGAANPAPPVGPALGSAGVNIMQFCKEFNAKTQKQAGLITVVSMVACSWRVERFGLFNVFVFGKYQIPDSSDLLFGNYFVPVFSDE